MATPGSQKAGERPISFFLYDRGAGVDIAAPLDLVLRPEDLSRQEPSRTAVSQTLGGAWTDDFGRGVSSISINGHTGWRGGLHADGAEEFRKLRDQVFVRWHELRAQHRRGGRDPDDIELIFADALDDITAVVAPMSFQLRRHKSRPLLMQYSIQMTLLRDADAPARAVDHLLVNDPTPASSQVSEAAVEAIEESAKEQRSLGHEIAAKFEQPARVIHGLTQKSAALLETVTAAVNEGTSVYDAVAAPALFLATEVQAASRNLAQTLTAPLALAERHRRTMAQLAAAFGEAYCNLRNNFPSLRRYLDFDDLFGASNCSSTSGGRPPTAYADTNPFLLLYPPATHNSGVTTDGAAAIRESSGDVLALNGKSKEEKLDLVRRVSEGLA